MWEVERRELWERRVRTTTAIAATTSTFLDHLGSSDRQTTDLRPQSVLYLLFPTYPPSRALFHTHIAAPPTADDNKQPPPEPLKAVAMATVTAVAVGEVGVEW